MVKQATPQFALNPALDARALAKRFQESGRIHISGLLDPASADAMHAQLRARTDWNQVINSGERLVELTRPTRAGLSAAQQADLDNAVYAGAREGFQFRYESIRVPDETRLRATSNDPLAAFAAWLSRGAARDFLRVVMQEPKIAYADAQATAYSPGDFLTGHDDAVPGKHRLAAYVFNLTPIWRPEWGGLLLFHDRDGVSVDGFSPVHNALNLFRVPQVHSVSEVTRAAAFRRYAITGWLRSKG